ncbi:MAG: CocE/NonD family hydrolase, partial [Pelistega sp.]|nr:CocE/NonD family hydrolase [Pelistega sp.]
MSTTSYQLLANQMVSMRDGIHLATDIYLPTDGKQSWPVVIERTPYNKSNYSRSEINRDGHKISREEMAAAFCQQGFAVIFQDCRGRYNSEGEFIKYTREGEDGFDTYAWIMQQPWCNGSIGSMGLSYAAHTQMAAACLNPPGLKTMVLDSGGFHNAFRCGARQGGAFELKQATWAFKQAALSPLAKENPQIKAALSEENIRDWFAKMPWQPGHSPLRHHPEYENYLFEQWQEGFFTDYWKQLGIYAEGYYATLPDIPVLFMSSWYDAYVPTTLSNFNAFKAAGRKAPQHLIMGPWLHGDRNITHSGNAEFGEAAAFDNNLDKDWLTCRLKWFNTHLKENPSTDTKTPVALFIMGGGSGKRNADGRIEHGGHWVYGDSWPLAGAQTQQWFLHPDMSLSRDQAKEGSLCFQSDPRRPVPTIGGSITSGLPVFAGGAFDQRESPEFFGTDGTNMPLAARADILVFQTEPLNEDLTVAGKVKIKLWVDSDVPDTDFTAKLVDVYPPSEDYPQGYAMNITDGIFRARYRESWTEATWLEKGKVVEITVEPFETCNVFKKGHRLRLDIAGSNFPHFDCNPNSGEPEGQARKKQIATNNVHTGGIYASVL